MGSLPLTFAAATTTTLLGQAMGLCTINIPQYFYRDFQSLPSQAEQILPTSSPEMRLAAYIAFVMVSNQLMPFLEEVACRWLLQDKILTWLTPKMERQVVTVGKNKGSVRRYFTTTPIVSERTKTIARIVITSLLFGWVHYQQEIDIGYNTWRSSSETMEKATLAFFSTIGNSLVYGYVYQKSGLAASFGAHAAWNMFFDLWFFNSWKLKT